MLEIPSEVAEEVDDDDDENFATSATSETQVFGTRLSPPPFQRSASSDTVPQRRTISNSSTPTIQSTTNQQIAALSAAREPAEMSQNLKLDTTTNNQIDQSPSVSSSTFATPISPQSLAEEPLSFYDSVDDDDDFSTSNEGYFLSYRSRAGHLTRDSFKGYSLPKQGEEDKSVDGASPRMTNFNTETFITRRDSAIPSGGMNFLGGPIDTGLDDFVSELGLMVHGIGNDMH
jgi:hypothetical protein